MRLSTRYPYTAYPPGAVRLVEAQDERVGVLGALDGVQDEPAVDARERAGGDGAEADRRVQRDRLARRRPPSCQPPAWGRRAYVNACRPMSASGSGLRGARRSEIRSVSPNAE